MNAGLPPQVFTPWGLFHPEVRDGRLSELRPFAADPYPVSFGASLVDAVHSPLRITDLVRPGVVQIATGAWYDPDQPGNPDGLCKHGNPNALTLDIGSSRLAQAPISQTTLVQVSRCDNPPPD